MLRRVASHLSGLASSSLGSISGKIAGLTGGFGGGIAAAKAQAANLLNKSPLEVKDVSSTGVLTENPFNYGTAVYPTGTGLIGEGHYMMFYIVENDVQKFKNAYNISASYSLADVDFSVGQTNKQTTIFNKIKSGGTIDKTILRGQKSGLASKYTTHSRVTDSIILYQPHDSKVSYKTNYENAETQLAGFLGQSSRELLDGNFLDFLKAIGGAGGEYVKNALLGTLEIIPGVGDASAAVDKARGKAVNPQLEFAFKSVPFRQFSYPFVFAPRNRKEMETVHNIIAKFKFAMMPDIPKNSPLFISPSEFEIRYMYKDTENLYMPKVSRCVLTDMDLDYAPEGKFTTFRGDEKGASPTVINMTLSFTELEVMTKARIADGY